MTRTEFVEQVKSNHSEAIAEFAMSGYHVVSFELYTLAQEFYFGEKQATAARVRTKLKKDMDQGAFV